MCQLSSEGKVPPSLPWMTEPLLNAFNILELEKWICRGFTVSFTLFLSVLSQQTVILSTQKVEYFNIFILICSLQLLCCHNNPQYRVIDSIVYGSQQPPRDVFQYRASIWDCLMLWTTFTGKLTKIFLFSRRWWSVFWSWIMIFSL